MIHNSEKLEKFGWKTEELKGIENKYGFVAIIAASPVHVRFCVREGANGHLLRLNPPIISVPGFSIEKGDRDTLIAKREKITAPPAAPILEKEPEAEPAQDAKMESTSKSGEKKKSGSK